MKKERDHSENLILKVCGMREADNIAELVKLKPDWMGFIFYSKSKRFAGDVSPEILKSIPSEIKKVGVFVNEDLEYVLKTVEKYNLDMVQLHSGESLEYCTILKSHGLKIMKVFSVGEGFDLSEMEPFTEVADYFLVDTKGPGYGGHGVAFDWGTIADYKYKTPLLLSGGIDADLIKSQAYENLSIVGLDLNSRFELSPGVKNIELLKDAFDSVRSKANQKTI